MAKRGRKPGKERKGYFYEREEEAVIRYNASEDVKEKERIYNEILYPAFTKMIESIIRRYNLYIPDEEFKETFDDTMSFLTTKLCYFDPNRNFKAYSYCGTVCKNYLIYKINQFTRRQNRNLSYDSPNDKIQEDISDNLRYSYNDDDNPLSYFQAVTSTTVLNIKKLIEKGQKEGSEKPITESEAKVGLALISLLENWEELFVDTGSNKFNKSSVNLFIKEYTGLSPKEVSRAMKFYRTCYSDLRKILLKDGW